MRAAASAARIPADNSMVIGGSIQARFAKTEEGELRASVLVVETDIKIALVSCDVLALQKDIVDDLCEEIEEETGIPHENILVTATHTHHAPTTVSVHGYERDNGFCENLRNSAIAAASEAARRLDFADGIRMRFGLGQEDTVGQNSRLLLRDGTIYWVGTREDALKPTGPVDPGLPVISFEGSRGRLEALLFCHSAHNIGTRIGGARSPGFYGLAAQELERTLGGTVLFLPGSFGSTHNLILRPCDMISRIRKTIEKTLSESKQIEPSTIVSIKSELEYRVRRFDEEAEDEAVSRYCRTRLGDPETTIETFRRMRRLLFEHQGETRKSWLHLILLGDIALVGVPGEFFTELGLQIKQRSPFRHTYVIGLANDYIGYIPDQQAFDLGGYQVWTGLHSFVEKGTGESVVAKATQMLHDLYKRGPTHENGNGGS